MTRDLNDYSGDESFSELVKPIWLAKYTLLFSTIFFSLILIASLFLIRELINFNSDTFYHQDIRFNEKLDQSLYSSLISEERIKRIYKMDDIKIKDVDEISISLINNSSRYDEMKKFIINDTEELLINLLNTDNNDNNNDNNDDDLSKEDLWKDYLDLDSNNHQIIFHDKNISEITAIKIITNLINDFNNEININNALKKDLLSIITYEALDSSDDTDYRLDYISNRLERLNSMIRSNEDDFKQIGLDVSNVYFNIDYITALVFQLNQKFLTSSIAKLEFQISQNKILKDNLSDLYFKFTDPLIKKRDDLETQITVDAISQLIDLGKDISDQDFNKQIMESLFNLELQTAEKKNELFEIETIIDLYNEKSSEFQNQQIEDSINFLAFKLIDEVNGYSQMINEKNIENAVSAVGNILTNKDRKYEMNIISISMFIIIIFLSIRILSLYLRRD